MKKVQGLYIILVLYKNLKSLGGWVGGREVGNGGSSIVVGCTSAFLEKCAHSPNYYATPRCWNHFGILRSYQNAGIQYGRAVLKSNMATLLEIQYGDLTRNPIWLPNSEIQYGRAVLEPNAGIQYGVQNPEFNMTPNS